MYLIHRVPKFEMNLQNRRSKNTKVQSDFGSYLFVKNSSTGGESNTGFSCVRFVN